jgi:hypothetical protein
MEWSAHELMLAAAAADGGPAVLCYFWNAAGFQAQHVFA